MVSSSLRPVRLPFGEPIQRTRLRLGDAEDGLPGDHVLHGFRCTQENRPRRLTLYTNRVGEKDTEQRVLHDAASALRRGLRRGRLLAAQGRRVSEDGRSGVRRNWRSHSSRPLSCVFCPRLARESRRIRGACALGKHRAGRSGPFSGVRVVRIGEILAERASCLGGGHVHGRSARW